MAGFHHVNLKAGHVPNRRRPLLAGLAAEMIAAAFHEARRGSCHVYGSKHGGEAIRESRKNAARAIRWVRQKSNWTLIPLERRMRIWGQPGPPADARAEYAGTFSWACEILNLAEDQVRRDGPPFKSRMIAFAYQGLKDWKLWRASRGQKMEIPRRKVAQKRPAVAQGRAQVRDRGVDDLQHTRPDGLLERNEVLRNREDVHLCIPCDSCGEILTGAPDAAPYYSEDTGAILYMHG